MLVILASSNKPEEDAPIMSVFPFLSNVVRKTQLSYFRVFTQRANTHKIYT